MANGPIRHFAIPFGVAGDIGGIPPSLVMTGRGCLTSLTLYNADAAAQEFALVDGTTATGIPLVRTAVAATSGGGPWTWPLHTLHFERGLYVPSNPTTMSGVVAGWVDHDCGWYIELEKASWEAQIVAAGLDLASVGRGMAPG